jgi:FlaA1/EpsC-like NDP-sugar epimerase
MDTANDSQIANFYKDRSIFITGATGFMGKVSF